MRLISERSYRSRNLYIQNIAVSRLISERELSARTAEKQRSRSRLAFPDV